MAAKMHRARHISDTKPWLSNDSKLPRKPLIDFCTNEWRNHDRKHQQFQDAFLGKRSSLRLLPLKRKWVKWWIGTICVTSVLILWLTGITGVTSSTVGDDTGSISASVLGGKESESSRGHFGTNKVPPLDGVTQLGVLEASLLPSSAQTTPDVHKRRLIFIGDIHGCYEELMHLLTKLDYKEATDHIVTTGDMVNKGPDSQGVVDFLISKRASCVRGNHDDRILLKAAQSIKHTGHQGAQDDPEMALARSLTDAQLAYLRSCPVVLDVGQVAHHGKVVVVHGGLVPSVELADQDPWAVMNMRIIHSSTHVPSKEHKLEDHVPWSDLWNQYQEHHLNSESVSQSFGKSMLNNHLRTLVVYGHDAKSGLRIQRYTKGLDSGCVTGRKLTALVMSSKSMEDLVQVKCKQYA